MRKGLLLVLISSVFLVAAPPVGAWNLHPHRWQEPGNIHYNYTTEATQEGIPGWLAPYLEGSAERWSQTPTPLIVTRGAGDIWLSSYNANDGNVGFAVCWDEDGGLCRKAVIRINLRDLSAQTTRVNWWIFLHEFGHVFGIDHSDVVNSVMHSPADCRENGGTCPTQPRQDDIDGINARYNFRWDGDNDGACDSASFARSLAGATKGRKYQDIASNAGSALTKYASGTRDTVTGLTQRSAQEVC